MRISTNQMATDSVADIAASMSQVQADDLQLSTGLAVNEPSDNPAAAGQIVDLDSDLSLNAGYATAAHAADSQLQESASTLGQVLTLLDSAQTSAETGLNTATESQSDKDALATQVDSVLQQVLSLANTSQNGQSLFAGFQTQQAAFTTTSSGGQITAVTYQGDQGVNNIQVGSANSVADNLPGDSVFDAPGSSVFQSLIAIRDALQSGDSTALSSGLSQLQSSMQTVTTAQSHAGALDQTLQDTETSLTAMKTSLTTSLGQDQNTDMAATATAYQQALTTYESGIQAAGLVAQLPSIVNYM